MDFTDLAERGLVLLGCGKMGGAMLDGWLAAGLPANAVSIIDPHPSDFVRSVEANGAHVNQGLPASPAVCIIAVKPQMMTDSLPKIKALGGGKTLFVSIAAGTPISAFEKVFGPDAPIVRAMPNTPAAIGQGITAFVGNARASAADLDLSEALLSAIGQVVRLENEADMDAVTAVSGSGPAYVFHLIETLSAAGVTQGLSPDLSLALARATVAGAGQLALTGEDPGTLRKNVTSPGGTTAAALGVLMDEDRGFPDLLTRAVAAAADRSRELSST